MVSRVQVNDFQILSLVYHTKSVHVTLQETLLPLLRLHHCLPSIESIGKHSSQLLKRLYCDCLTECIMRVCLHGHCLLLIFVDFYCLQIHVMSIKELFKQVLRLPTVRGKLYVLPP